MPLLVNAICNRCQNKSDLWLNRDAKGNPDFQGCVCEKCGSVNCTSRDWTSQQMQTIIPPVDDGRINRFEYSYKDENGKTHTKKVDPSIVEKHFSLNSRKGNKQV